MPAMGGRGGGLMVPRGGMGRRSSCYPGGSGPGIPPSVHKAGRRASSRSEAGIGLFPGLLGGGGKNQVLDSFFVQMAICINIVKYLI